jgi:hypothetical protein
MDVHKLCGSAEEPVEDTHVEPQHKCQIFKLGPFLMAVHRALLFTNISGLLSRFKSTSVNVSGLRGQILHFCAVTLFRQALLKSSATSKLLILMSVCF